MEISKCTSVEIKYECHFVNLALSLPVHLFFWTVLKHMIPYDSTSKQFRYKSLTVQAF